jgi:hypothetical protein
MTSWNTHLLISASMSPKSDYVPATVSLETVSRMSNMMIINALHI